MTPQGRNLPDLQMRKQVQRSNQTIQSHKAKKWLEANPDMVETRHSILSDNLDKNLFPLPGHLTPHTPKSNVLSHMVSSIPFYFDPCARAPSRTQLSNQQPHMTHDSTLSFTVHIHLLPKNCWFYFLNIRWASVHSFIHSLIHSVSIKGPTPMYQALCARLWDRTANRNNLVNVELQASGRTMGHYVL